MIAPEISWWFGTLTALPTSCSNDAKIDFVVGAGALGERRGLQAVRELVDGETVGDLRKRAEHAERTFGDSPLMLGRFLTDHRPLLGGRLVHSREGLGHRPKMLCQGAPTRSAALSRKNSRPAARGCGEPLSSE